MRRHVLQNLLDTEQSYVTNLNFMINVSKAASRNLTTVLEIYFNLTVITAQVNNCCFCEQNPSLVF